MAMQRPPRRLPKIQFRVLIIGRANAGKTSILQRVCDTTESPIVYRRGDDSDSDSESEFELGPSMDRGEHTIEDQLMFSNHRGYVFHDSCGIESGSKEELVILQEFIRRKCAERRLGDKLHAIWFCIPMDNQRPGLDLRFFNDICPDKNVPVIAVFTKYDQFRRNVGIDMEDYGNPDDKVSEVAEKLFQEHYLHPLGDGVVFVRLEQMHIQNRRCDDLIEKTTTALNDDTVAVMLLVVQKGNLNLSVKTALNRVPSGAGFKADGAERIVRECLFAFPFIWWYRPFREELLELPPLELRPEFLFSELFFLRLNPFVVQVMSLPTIQNLTSTSLSGHHLILAVILILKHATFIRLSHVSSESALTHAELHYRHANINSNIQRYLTTSSQEHSIELFAAFIMATDIVPSESSVEDRA